MSNNFKNKNYMVRFFYLIIFLFTPYVYSENHDKPLKKNALSQESKILVDEVKGVIFISDSKEMLTTGLDNYKGIHLIGIEPPGSSKNFKIMIQRLLIGKPLTKAALVKAEERILCYYRANGYPFVIVNVPEQKITKGIIQLIIKESHIGKICFQGNKFFSSETMRKNICLAENGRINSNTVLDDLTWINRNPFRETIGVFRPGEMEATTDVFFITKDKRPFRVIVGADNLGFEATGTERIFAGVQIANLFRADHLLSYQYITSTMFGKFYAHTAQYIIPLPWRHLLDFYGGYSGISAIMPIDGVKSKGQSWQASVRYIVPLRSKGAYTHEVRCGIDYKQSDVNLVLDAIPILGNQTVISQGMLGYNSSFESPAVNTSFELLWFVSPGDIFAHQSTEAYSTLRPFAKSNYTYVRGSVVPIFHLPKCYDAMIKMEFQVANQNLLSSEQFGLGGMYTVRGYNEREINTDNAFLLSSELRSPIFRPLSKNKKKGKHEILQFLAFIDYGFGTNHKPLPSSSNFLYLLGTGIGIRYFYNSNINFRADWGYPLHKKISSNIIASGSMAYFSVIASF